MKIACSSLARACLVHSWKRHILLAVIGTGALRLCAQAAADAPTLDAYLDRSYYTTEKQASLVCEWSRPLEGGTATLTVKDAQGMIVARGETKGQKTEIAIPLDQLPAATHPLVVEVHGGANESATRPLELIKRPPKPDFEWKIDRVNHSVLRDGVPFFPFGLVMGGMVAPRDEPAFREVSELGFNTIVRWYQGVDPATANALHELADKYHLCVVDPVDRFAKENLTSAKMRPEFGALVANNLERLRAGVNRIKESRNLAAYYGLDEPVKGEVAAGRMLYRDQRDLDGYHPSLVVYSSEIPNGDEFVDWCDILATDPYWTPAETNIRGNVNYMAKIVEATRKRADAAHKVMWIMPMAETWSGVRKRAILPKEQVCQSYLALIHGAKGLIYFRYPFTHQTAAETFAALGKEMAVLGPIALTPAIPQEIHYTPQPFEPEHDQFPDVHVSLHRNPSGGYVLLAANTRPFPVDAKYRVSLLGVSGEITHLFNASKYPVRDGSFVDLLGCLETRAYVLPAGDLPSQPVQITVESIAHPNDTDPVYGAVGLPDTGRVGKKNLLRNPSFEEASLSDWPDYYQFSMEGPRLGVPGSKSLYGLDTANAFEGRACLWLRPTNPRSPLRFFAACAPLLKEPQKYTLSAYLRADHDGVKVHFVGFGYRIPKATFGYQEFTLTTQWQRFTETGTLPPKLPHWHSVGIEILPNQSATVFVDAMQFEQGESATVFEP